jgi:hypothetical protein
VEAGLPSSNGAERDLRHSEIASAPGGAVGQRAHSNAEEARINRVAPEYAGLVAVDTGAIAHLILQCSIERTVIWRYCVGEGTSSSYLVLPGVLQKLAGETDVCLLAGQVRMRAAVQPQLEHESLTHHHRTTISGRSGLRSEIHKGVIDQHTLEIVPVGDAGRNDRPCWGLCSLGIRATYRR